MTPYPIAVALPQSDDLVTFPPAASSLAAFSSTTNAMRPDANGGIARFARVSDAPALPRWQYGNDS